MVKLGDCRAISQKFHELAKLKFLLNPFKAYGLFITLVSRVVWFKEQLCLYQMVQNFKIGGI